MKNSALAFAVILAALIAVPQQTVAQESPETHRLGEMIGEWTYESLDGSNTCEWLGDYAVRCLASWTNADGNARQTLFVNHYDPESEVYTAYRFFSSGYVDSGISWVEGDTFTTVYESPSGNRYRVTNVRTGDTFNYQWHTSTKGGAWEAGSSGSATLVK